MKSKPTTEVIGMIGRVLEELNAPTAKALTTLAKGEAFEGEQSYSVPALGVEVSVNQSGIVTSAHMHSDGHEGFGAFPFDFRGISFSSSRAEVQMNLGKPLRSGSGRTGPWDVYEVDGVRMHFLYSNEAAVIVMVTAELSSEV